MSFRICLSVSIILAILATLNVHAKGQQDLPTPGTVLSEKSHDLGNGYRIVNRSVVNPPGHWEGIGHFQFVYAKGEQLCQCSDSDVAISPDGGFAIYVQSDGKLMLFRASNKIRKRLSNTFIGYPKKADWKIHAKRVLVTLDKYDQAGGKISAHFFSF
ncbi:MAG: hypothetical protein V4488_06940 [Pseudomonadota bacterium]